MKYFFDNCLSPKLARMLAAIDVDAVALRDEFPSDIKDVDLFQSLSGSGYVFITSDARQKTIIGEARALKDSGMTALWLGPFWMKMDFWGHAKWIINRWQMIDGFASGADPGTCAEVKHNGRARPFVLDC